MSSWILWVPVLIVLTIAGFAIRSSRRTAICFGRAARRDQSTLVILPTALYLA